MNYGKMKPPLQAVRQLLERVASADITMHEVQGGAHELFVGLEREQVTEYILQWVDAQLSPDTLSEPSDHRMVKSCSLISVTGNPFEWRPHGMSPASSIYGKCVPAEYQKHLNMHTTAISDPTFHQIFIG